MKKPKPVWVVHLGGVPCTLRKFPRLFGHKLVPAGGTLVPSPNDPHYFKGEKSAQKAVGRAERLRNTLLSAVFSLTDDLKPFAQSGEFTLQKRV